ncbi:MAG: hypothetical protein LBU83_03325 [Bacteroidales bacterium]|jgi:hypothetical protein|nr:hypothetical protein [Bacteroidales bacterium]
MLLTRGVEKIVDGWTLWEILKDIVLNQVQNNSGQDAMTVLNYSVMGV